MASEPQRYRTRIAAAMMWCLIAERMGISWIGDRYCSAGIENRLSTFDGMRNEATRLW